MRSVSSFDSRAVDRPVSAASLESVSRFWVRSDAAETNAIGFQRPLGVGNSFGHADTSRSRSKFLSGYGFYMILAVRAVHAFELFLKFFFWHLGCVI